ncbi:PTS lactose/cellobiose transporter subunit IIA [Enterococcus italicus]|uniref:PTS lactose/cellobiose transporter subunit IIA n=1 Tax=Enterococcus italicus TaxID=246144 RepID=UPI0028A6BE2D|nr:PTS lactose/cellobiose transporter subunit IIA [Enterococcus italicus]
MSQEQLEAIMGLIVNAGNAKSDAMEAIQAAKKGEFEEADEKLKAAEAALLEAHHAQTKLLTAETNGEALTITLLTIHSQDHLMTSITFNDLAKEVIDVYRRLG